MASEEAMRNVVDETGTSDLKFIMTDCEVPLRAQYDSVRNSVTSSQKLANLEEIKDNVREVLKRQFYMDGGACIGMRVQVVAILDVRGSAKDYIKKEDGLGAVAGSGHEPKEILGPEQTITRRKQGKWREGVAA